MSAYKEIQVPVEKVKEVYEKFYKELKELEQPAKEKEEKCLEAYYAFEEKETKLRAEYYSLLGLRDLFGFSAYSWNYDYPSTSIVPRMIMLCEQVFEAVDNANQFITMTPDQVHDLELARNGECIACIKGYISDPIVEEESQYQRMIDDLKKKKEQESPKEVQKQEVKIEKQVDQGSFGGAIFGIVCLFALVCVMIKSCS